MSANLNIFVGICSYTKAVFNLNQSVFFWVSLPAQINQLWKSCTAVLPIMYLGPYASTSNAKDGKGKLQAPQPPSVHTSPTTGASRCYLLLRRAVCSHNHELPAFWWCSSSVLCSSFLTTGRWTCSRYARRVLK